jgi:hypothetical protein
MMIGRDRFLGVDRIAVAAEGADDEAAPRHRLFERSQLAGVGQQRGRLAVRIAWIRAAADLHGFDTGILQIIERLLERLLPEQHREHADLHRATQLLAAAARSIASTTR